MPIASFDPPFRKQTRRRLMRPMRSIPISAFAILMGASLWAFGASQQLPEGAGKDTLEKICTTCHTIDTVTDARRTKAGWQDIVSDMAGRGADGTPQELSAIVSYLTKFYGQINVNSAASAELAAFLGINEKQARTITDYRAQHGAFKNLEQLKQTPGVDADQLQQKRDLIAFRD